MDDPNTRQNSASASFSSKGKECAAFGWSNIFYGPDGSPTRCHFFKFPKDTSQRKRWCNLIKRQLGKDSFFVTNSTEICSDHLKNSWTESWSLAELFALDGSTSRISKAQTFNTVSALIPPVDSECNCGSLSTGCLFSILLRNHVLFNNCPIRPILDFIAILWSI